MFHGNHKVLDARAPRLDHRLDHRPSGASVSAFTTTPRSLVLSIGLSTNASWSSVVGVLSMKILLSCVTVSVIGS